MTCKFQLPTPHWTVAEGTLQLTAATPEIFPQQKPGVFKRPPKTGDLENGQNENPQKVTRVRSTEPFLRGFLYPAMGTVELCINWMVEMILVGDCW